MNQFAAYRVRSPRACEGKGGFYEMRLHRLPRGGRPQLETVPLVGDCDEIDQGVDFSSLTNPVDVLAALQKHYARLGAARFRPEELVTASLIRMCTRSTHVGLSTNTGRGNQRPEAALRRVWLPVAAALGAPALRLTGAVELDENGIGEIRVPGGQNTLLRRPALSVPVTLAEGNAAVKLAVPATAGSDAEHSTYVLLHPMEGSRQSLEQVIRLVPLAGPPNPAT